MTLRLVTTEKKHTSGRAVVIVVLAAAIAVTVLFMLYVRQLGVGAQRQSCLNRRGELAQAERAYFRRHGRVVTGGAATLSQMEGLTNAPDQTHCSGDGQFSAEQDAQHRLVIHCSLPEHDRNPDGTTGLLVPMTP